MELGSRNTLKQRLQINVVRCVISSTYLRSKLLAIGLDKLLLLINVLGQNCTLWTTVRGITSYSYVILYVLKLLGVCRTDKCFVMIFKS
jgi:hypothetical protein